MISRKLTKFETIESLQTYFEAINELNFTLIRGTIYDFHKYFNEKCNFPPNIEISKLKRINYLSNGSIECFKTYKEVPTIYSLFENFDSKILNFNELSLENNYFFSKNKCQDVLSLMKYLKPENKAFIVKHIEKFGLK